VERTVFFLPLTVSDMLATVPPVATILAGIKGLAAESESVTCWKECQTAVATVLRSGNGQMTQVERLMALFRAFRERDEESFYRAADAIIADELAANHHVQARELQRALATKRDTPSRPAAGLSQLPRDRRHGEPLVLLQEPSLDSQRLMLVNGAQIQLTRVVEEVSLSHKLAKHGLRPKSRLLFWGPPGCGKTMTAHWLAHQLGLPIGIVRLNSLITSFLGETATHIQRVFDMAQSTPMVLLIDEADAIAKERDDRNDVGELKRVVNSLLQAIDSFRPSQSIIIAASNHQYLFDDALWRRFDDIVFFPPPAPSEIIQFVSRMLNGVTLTGNLETAARAMTHLSYAQIEQTIIEVLKSMVLQDKTHITAAEITAQAKGYKRLLKTARQRSPSKPPRDE
jgi:hypothetical protein